MRSSTDSASIRRAATECLAIIAYHEPASRGEIEAIRGVQISDTASNDFGKAAVNPARFGPRVIKPP